MVDSDAEFNLTVVDGPSDMQYAMEFDNEAGGTPYNDSSMLREMFSVPGEYIVTATANDVNNTVHIWHSLATNCYMQKVPETLAVSCALQPL